MDGVEEEWSLQWAEPPQFNGCLWAMTCVCNGVEWGLGGHLMLVRNRPGAPREELDLNVATSELPWIPYTSQEPGEPSIPGFDPPAGEPTEDTLLSDVVSWRQADAMRLRDYDHDGRATEFALKVGYIACGQDPSVVVGISRANPKLHVFTAPERPNTPIVMTYLWEWDAIAKATGPWTSPSTTAATTASREFTRIYGSSPTASI